MNLKNLFALLLLAAVFVLANLPGQAADQPASGCCGSKAACSSAEASSPAPTAQAADSCCATQAACQACCKKDANGKITCSKGQDCCKVDADGKAACTSCGSARMGCASQDKGACAKSSMACGKRGEGHMSAHSAKMDCCKAGAVSPCCKDCCTVTNGKMTCTQKSACCKTAPCVQ